MFLGAEALLRTSLFFLGYPFVHPNKYLEKHFYPNLEDARNQIKSFKKNERVILILGGSVVSSVWTGMENRIDSIIKKSNGFDDVKVINVAIPANTSRDNFIKYKLLQNEHFDLIIYYEAINENRANNIPKEKFEDDYSHMKWYSDINLILAHPEMNMTVIPYVIHLAGKRLSDKLTHKEYLSYEIVNEENVKYGGDIKTGVSYLKNLSGIADLAKNKNEKLLLVKYGSYFPPNVELVGKKDEIKYFTKCFGSSLISLWGTGSHVRRGIQVHNEMLEKVAKTHNTYLFDMDSVLPKDSTFFCDVCHLSEKGAQLYANKLTEFIVTQKLLSRKN